jgi:pimeloyl-ACP methyl ester carboxylesterase
VLVFLVLAGFYLVILVIVALAALKPARSPIFLSPAALGVEIEPVEINSGGLTLRGWWVPHDSPRAVAILCHGYVMNRSENAALAAQLRGHGFACLLFDSRGCGKSEGSRTGVGWLERGDVLAACAFAETRCPGLKRVVIGSSMGAAAAAFAIAEDPSAADAVILDSCYHSLARATLGWWRFLGGVPLAILLAPVVLVAWPIAGFNPFRANVGRALRRIDRPVLIIHGRRDRLAPPFHADLNFASGNAARIVWFDSAGHSEARWTESDRYLDSILGFLREANVI